MTKRALIAEPDQDEALRQAAILKDDGYDAQVFVAADLVLFVEQTQPDVVVLRHERPGVQTGLALVPRLKSVAPGTAIVLTTSDLTPDAIEKNKKQRVHPDWYLRLPADRGELVGAARAVPQVLDASVADAEEERPLARDPSRPPPLPTAGLRSLATLPKAGPRSGEAVLTAEDLTFVEKVFSSIQHIDADAPIQEPPPAVVGETPDRKLALLRTKLKERERDLAKLSRLWRAREEDLRQQEAKVQQKDIEVEGLRLRISELTGELELAQATLVDKEADWGRQIGDTYDQHSLNEAELIQQVAGKEAEVNSLKTKLRKTEDAAATERKEFTNRVLEWEKAYAEFEQHHWKVVVASVDEVQRLQDQVQQRDQVKGRLRADVRDRDNTITKLREQKLVQKAELFASGHEAALGQERAVAVVQSALAQEQRKRRLVQDELYELRAAIVVVEEDLRRHQKLLGWFAGEHRKHIARLAQVVREGESERIRLRDEREIYRRRTVELEGALSQANALGESVAATLFALDDRKSLVAREQIRVRDHKLTELSEDRTRLQTSVEDLTSRLGQSEMDHASENARADELERDLAHTRERAAATETRLQNGLEGMTGECARLTDKLQATEQHLSTTRDDLSHEKHNRQQRELEVQNIVERKDNEIADRSQRVADLERHLGDAKEDIGNLRRTMSTRDERITELLNRVRQADEKQVQLEAQIFRLDASNSERESTIIARDERIAVISEKLNQRDGRLELVEGELKKSQSSVLDHKAQLDRQDAHLAELQKQLASSREETQQSRVEVQARSTELFESERRASNLTAELQNARAEINAGSAVAEQLQSQLGSAEARNNELRRTLEDSDAKLRASLGELEAAGQRTDQIRKDLAAAKEALAQRSNELSDRARAYADVERARDQVSATLQQTRVSLEQQTLELEGEKRELEEQLSQQLTENGSLSASLSDAATHIEELQGRARQLEGVVADREGRISAQGQVLNRAEQQSSQQQALLGEREQELSDVRAALDDARRSIDERAKWLATRDQSIAELKLALDAEKKQAINLGARSGTLEQQLAQATAEREKLQASLAQKDQQLSTTSSSTSEALVNERKKTEDARVEWRRVSELLAAKEAELAGARAAEARLTEVHRSEAHVRAEYQKLRAQAEKIVGDNKTLKAIVEKIDGEKKLALGDVEKLRAEMNEVRAQAGAQQAHQARADAELQAKQLSDVRAQLQRAVLQNQLVLKQKQDADLELEAAKGQAEANKASALEAQQAELTRLGRELLEARKAQRDAVAQAQQSKAEADQIKKMAAQRLAQTKVATFPPVAAAPRAVPAVGAASLVPHAVNPPRPAPQDGLSSEGAFDPPTVAVHAPAPATMGGDAYEGQKTLMVERPSIPSLARGPSEKG